MKQIEKSRSTSKTYCLVLDNEQMKFLIGTRGMNRMKCLYSMMELAKLAATHYRKETGFETTLKVGQFAMTETELAKMWGCSRNAASNLLDEFNRLRLVSSDQGRRTSVHTILCMSAWVMDNLVIPSPDWKRPSSWRVLTSQDCIQSNEGLQASSVHEEVFNEDSSVEQVIASDVSPFSPDDFFHAEQKAVEDEDPSVIQNEDDWVDPLSDFGLLQTEDTPIEGSTLDGQPSVPDELPDDQGVSLDSPEEPSLNSTIISLPS